ncbi:MAG: hydroxyacid dehydrogenase [Burkholderiales bacterium]
MAPKVLLTQEIHPEVQARLARSAELVVAPDTSADTLRRCAVGCSVVVVRAQLPDDIFDVAPSLIGAVRHGAGIDMIPIDAATAHGVLVANVPGANAIAVAEHALRSMLELARAAPVMADALYAGRSAAWKKARAMADRGFELSGRTLGLIGYGNVGRALARMCSQGLGMKVLTCTRKALPLGEAWATREPLADLLQNSDFVVLACPLTHETRGLVGATELALMRPGAFLVNVARGPVVVEAALVDALRSARLAGAAIDVFDQPPLPDDHPFWALPQVLVTPHVAGITEESMSRMGAGAAGAVEQILRGDIPENCVNPQAISAFKARFSTG